MATAVAMAAAFLSADIKQVRQPLAGCRLWSAHLRVCSRLAGAARRPGLGDTTVWRRMSKATSNVGTHSEQSSMRGEAVVVYDGVRAIRSGLWEEFRGGAHGLGVRQEKGRKFSITAISISARS